MSKFPQSVLIVDDEESIRQSFVDYFEDRLWRTLQGESGEQALELLGTESPDGAIVDIRLGGMDGNAFIRAAHGKKPNMVFVICTGSPLYIVPDDLLSLPSVSKHLFKKPVSDITEMETELLRLIASQNKNAR